MDDRGPCPPALERSPSRSRCVCLTIGEVTPPKRPPILGPLELGEPIGGLVPPPPTSLLAWFRSRPALESLFCDHGAPIAFHRGVVSGDKLSGDHAFHLILRPDAD